MLSDLCDGVRYLTAEGIADAKRVCIVGQGYGGYAALSGAVASDGVCRCAVSIGGISDLPAYTAWVSNHRPLPDPDKMGGLEADTWPRALKAVNGSQVTLTRYLGAADLAAISPVIKAAPCRRGKATSCATPPRASPEYVQLTDCDHELTEETCLAAGRPGVDGFPAEVESVTEGLPGAGFSCIGPRSSIRRAHDMPGRVQTLTEDGL